MNEGFREPLRTCPLCSSIGNSSGFPIEEQNNDAQLAGVMFIAGQSACARRMRIAHSFLLTGDSEYENERIL